MCHTQTRTLRSRKREVIEVKPRAHHATHKHLMVARGPSCLPMPTRNQRLRTLTGSHIWPQHDRPSFIVRSWPRLVDHHFKWPSGMPEPQFIRTHHMPTRLVTRREQEIDGSTAWTLMPTTGTSKTTSLRQVSPYQPPSGCGASPRIRAVSGICSSTIAVSIIPATRGHQLCHNGFRSRRLAAGTSRICRSAAGERRLCPHL